jgi:hypothetical protein
VSDVLHDVGKEVEDLVDPLSVDIDSLAAAAEASVSVKKDASLSKSTPQRPQASGDDAAVIPPLFLLRFNLFSATYPSDLVVLCDPPMRCPHAALTGNKKSAGSLFQDVDDTLSF